MFATASHDRTARLWLTDRISPVRILAGHLSDVETVKFHPNGNYVGTGSSDKTVRLWDIQSGECVRMLIGHHSAVNALSFSSDGRLCASAEDDRILLWDLASGKLLQTLLGHDTNQRIHTLSFNRNGRLLCSGSTDQTVRVWNIDEGDEEKTPSKTFYTKQTPIYYCDWLEKDIVMAGGVFKKTNI